MYAQYSDTNIASYFLSPHGADKQGNQKAYYTLQLQIVNALISMDISKTKPILTSESNLYSGDTIVDYRDFLEEVAWRQSNQKEGVVFITFCSIF